MYLKNHKTFFVQNPMSGKKKYGKKGFEKKISKKIKQK